MSSFYLFSYGTLLSGSPASALLLTGCEPIGDGYVDGILYDIDGMYPAVVLYGAEHVYGEVWKCPVEQLAKLDDYEGVRNGLFRRVALEVTMTDSPPLPCWLYVAGPALSRKLVLENRIHSGRFQPART